jgi:hypothetical protein
MVISPHRVSQRLRELVRVAKCWTLTFRITPGAQMDGIKSLILDSMLLILFPIDI